MEPSIAYLADGRLFLKLAGKEPREVESKFGNQVIARAQKNSQREAWKSAMCFEIEDEGKVVYSDGTRVYYLDGGKSVELVSGSLIQSVTVIDA